MLFDALIPASEVKKSVHFKDQYGMRITIEVNEHKWSVLWADNSATSMKNEAAVVENLKAAYDYVTERGFKLTEIKQPRGECPECCVDDDCEEACEK